jgi:hypothetical protein
LVDKLTEGMDNGLSYLGTFVDLKKAFDTVNHSILLEKLLYYGIRGTAHDFMVSYLSGRQQFCSFLDVEQSHCVSERAMISCGVPQGSIL